MRRFRNNNEFNFWPSFVDALSTLLIVVLFFLMLFVLAHFFMGQNLDTKNTEIDVLKTELSSLTKELSIERDSVKNLSSSLEAKEQEALKLSWELSGLKESQTKALAQIAMLEQDVEALSALKKKLEKETAQKTKSLENEKEISQESKAQLALLKVETKKLSSELSKLNALLEAARKKDKEKQVQIVNLGKKLNQALAAKASELMLYRSDFFGSLRKLLADRDDVRIVGDRFVFQSELFFKSGSAFLEEKGKKQLKVLAKTLKELSKKIPARINWVLRVDGHTDNIPIRNELYSSNWQLSANRAIAVVQYLIDEGVPANKLVAAGFGQYQPIENKNTAEARRKNRRIEFKLTQR